MSLESSASDSRWLARDAGSRLGYEPGAFALERTKAFAVCTWPKYQGNTSGAEAESRVRDSTNIWAGYGSHVERMGAGLTVDVWYTPDVPLNDWRCQVCSGWQIGRPPVEGEQLCQTCHAPTVVLLQRTGRIG
jgi:hypothetical protein